MPEAFPLAGRGTRPDDLVVAVGGLRLGAAGLVVAAGPCAVEGEETFLRTAQAVKAAGAHILRGGAFKPRTSPYSFQGLGREGLRLLGLARRRTGLPVITEVLDPRDVGEVAAAADVLQVGARNMQNFPLLKELGRAGKPVLLKRAQGATIEEWLLAAEYVLDSGNENVVLCERGHRLPGEGERRALDLGAVSLVRELSRLPVFVDPSHAAGRRGLVEANALAAAAAGARGLLVEVHENPDAALSDGAHSLRLEEFQALMGRLGRLAAALDGGLAAPPA
ncbi:MAG: 3-deoxy-7-phosphoheptulonate synthase [Elusimicrobia bacterium]|nr:3-deoxy-7-phosphoheptulonate synthase [Elusimicrobiota bacterium]